MFAGQQRLPAQLPLVHWSEAVHAVPSAAFATHVSVASQYSVLAQSLSAPQPQVPLTLQTAVMQSLAWPQPLPSAHVEHVPPPQSTSVSALSFAPSAHRSAWQVSRPEPPPVT
jgi:hypothetical protein